MRPIVILARSTRSPLARFTLGAVVLLAACAAPTSEEGREDSQEAIGENAFCPVAASISQGYSGGHDGIDLAAPFGTPIYATQAGVVTASGPAQGYGQWIRIRYDDGSMTEYGHMQRRDVSVNQCVNGGQQIAVVGFEGQSFGPYLHFRTYARAGDGRGINPIDYLRARGRTVQRLGRLMRPHAEKTDAALLDFVDRKVPLLRRHHLERRKLYAEVLGVPASKLGTRKGAA